MRHATPARFTETLTASAPLLAMAAPSHVTMDRHEPSPRGTAPRATQPPALRPNGQAPRPVAGPEGCRIRLQMGATGADYLLLLNEDDGNVEWQTRSWSDTVPAGLSAQLNRLRAANQFVREVGLGLAVRVCPRRRS